MSEFTNSIPYVEASKPLTKEEKKTFFISALGGSLEFYDFIVYVFFAHIIAKLFFDASSVVSGILLSFTVFASGYLARIFGGLFFSHMGDKNGRKNSFVLTVFLMAAPTLLIGVLPTYSQIGFTATILLILCRITQGLAIGGEIPCSITFIYEHASKSKKGLACGILFSGIILGIFLGSFMGTVLTKFLSEEQLYNFGWRIPFILGGILGFIGIQLRRHLRESPVFKKMDEELFVLPLNVLLKSYKLNLLQTTSTIWAVAVSVTLFLLYLPTYFHVYYKFNSDIILGINTIAVLFYSALIVFFGIVCDKIGPRKVLNFGLIIFILGSFFIFSSFVENNFIPIFICYLFASVATAAITSAGVMLLAASFPVHIRFSGASFSYNLAFGVFGGFTPLIATWLIKETELKASPAFYMILVALVALLLNTFINLENKSYPQNEI